MQPRQVTVAFVLEVAVPAPQAAQSRRHSNPAVQLWACLQCGRVGAEMFRVAISDVVTTSERRLCGECIREFRADPLVVVEVLEAIA